MSTRSHLQIVDGDEIIQFYRHSDGYPTGVLPDIVPVLRKIRENGRLNDTEYCAARFIQALCNEYDSWPKDLSGIGATGYGVCSHKDPHGDTEWLYRIYGDGKIEVCKPGGEVIATLTIDDDPMAKAKEIEGA